MEPDGKWKICHAYRPESEWVSQHNLSINGKRKDFTKDDLLTIAKQNSIRNPEGIISDVLAVVKKWPEYAKKYGVEDKLAKAIDVTPIRNIYELPSVYFIAVRGFRLDPSNRAKYYYSAKIIDELDQEILYPKLSYKLLVLPNFNKPVTGLDTIIDRWMYLMKHLDEMEGLPKYLNKRIFSHIFAVGGLANLTPEEKMSDISSLEQKRVYNATIAYAEKEGMKKGLEEGLEKGKLEERARIESIALGMKKDGLPIEQIAKYTKLTIEKIENLK